METLYQRRSRTHRERKLVLRAVRQVLTSMAGFRSVRDQS